MAALAIMELSPGASYKYMYGILKSFYCAIKRHYLQGVWMRGWLAFSHLFSYEVAV
jgi:hypothetical protein